MTDLQTAKLRVDFINPRVGDKPASIKADGKYWSVTDEIAARIKQGETHYFGYKAKAGSGKWAGRTFFDIVALIASDSSGDVTQAPRHQAPPGSLPTSNGGLGTKINGNGHAVRSDKDKDISVLALLKEYIKNGKVALERNAIGRAWQEVAFGIELGHLPEPLPADDGDEIPF